jgi:hypothetical protein
MVFIIVKMVTNERVEVVKNHYIIHFFYMVLQNANGIELHFLISLSLQKFRFESKAL